MPVKLDSRAQDFDKAFEALLATKREGAEDVDQAVQKIIADVVARGDAALVDYSRKFDRVDLAALGLSISAEDIAGGRAAASPAALAALSCAHERITAFHEMQRPEDLNPDLGSITREFPCSRANSRTNSRLTVN